MPGFMLRMQVKLWKFTATEEGQDLIEYAMLVSLIALAAIAGTRQLGDNIALIFTNISNSIA